MKIVFFNFFVFFIGGGGGYLNYFLFNELVTEDIIQ